MRELLVFRKVIFPCLLFSVFLLRARVYGNYELPQNVLLEESAWHRIVKFINTTNFPKKHTLIKSEKLACPVEYDASTNKIYIHLSHLPGTFLGKGGHKTVTKAILFSKQPKIVAQCEGDASTIEENRVWKKLSGLSGIVRLYSSIRRSSSRMVLFTEYFNSGIIRNIFQKFPHLTERELFHIADDLLTGLQNLHKAGYVHRDLHRGNLLLHKEDNQRLKAAIADLGKVIKNGAKARMIAFGGNCPPEVLLYSTSKIDRQKVDIYLMGLTLYFLATGNVVEWRRGAGINQYTVYKLSKAQRKNDHARIRALYEKAIRNVASASRSVELAKIALKMVHPIPKQRISLKQAHLEVKKFLLGGS